MANRKRALSFCIGVTVSGLTSPAAAQDFDWHKLDNQRTMLRAFQSTAAICVEGFGFTARPELPESDEADKLDAYLLLRDNPDAEVQGWANNVVAPVQAIMKNKSGVETRDDDHRAAAAAVAASEDPDAFDEAQARFLEAANAPYERALAACEAGVRDPFLGKFFWTGTGSAAGFEESNADWFAEFVSELKGKASKSPPH